MAIETWRDLVDTIKDADEETLKRLLEDERNGANRPTFLAKIYGRFATLRAGRERKELAGGS